MLGPPDPYAESETELAQSGVKFKNHFHLDLSRYRADGTRPQSAL